MQNNSQICQKSIDKIEAMAAECNTAGRHLKNIERVMAGKELIVEIKPNGKLAKLLESPFRVQNRLLKSAHKNAEKAISALEHLERTAEPHVAEKASVKEEMRRFKVKASRGRRAAPEKLSEVAL